MKSYSTKYFLVNWVTHDGGGFAQVGPFWTEQSLEAAKKWIQAQDRYVKISEPWEYPVWDHIGDD